MDFMNVLDITGEGSDTGSTVAKQVIAGRMSQELSSTPTIKDTSSTNPLMAAIDSAISGIGTLVNKTPEQQAATSKQMAANASAQFVPSVTGDPMNGAMPKKKSEDTTASLTKLITLIGA